MHTAVNDPYYSGHMRERFRSVILKAGYTPEAAESILARHFDEYMQNIPEFVKMLESYENDPDGDPE